MAGKVQGWNSDRNSQNQAGHTRNATFAFVTTCSSWRNIFCGHISWWVMKLGNATVLRSQISPWSGTTILELSYGFYVNMSAKNGSLGVSWISRRDRAGISRCFDGHVCYWARESASNFQVLRAILNEEKKTRFVTFSSRIVFFFLWRFTRQKDHESRHECF